MEKKIQPHKDVRFIVASHLRQFQPHPARRFETKDDLLKAVKRKRHSIKRLQLLQSKDVNQKTRIYLIKQVLRSSPPLKSFQVYLKGGLGIRNWQIFLERKALHGLRRLEVEFTEFNGLDLPIFSYALGSLSNLQSLTLLADKMNTVSDQTIEVLAKSLLKLKSLRDLSLIFMEWRNFSSLNYTPLLKIFKYLTYLKNLHLCFKNFYQIDNEFLSKLGNNLKDLHSLQTLSLSTYKRGNLNLKEGWSNLLQAVGLALKNLEHLNLDFAKCRYLEQEESSRILQSLLLFKGVKKLELEFSGTKFSDAGIQETIQVVKELDKVEKVKLGFKQCFHVSKEGVKRWEEFSRIKKAKNSEKLNSALNMDNNNK